MKFGFLAAALLVASCGTEPPTTTTTRVTYIPVDQPNTDDDRKNDEDAQANPPIADNEPEAPSDPAYTCLTEEACEPAQFGLTIVKNGEIEGENGELRVETETLIAQEGLVTDWRFSISSMLKLPGNREFRFVMDDLAVETGVSLEKKVGSDFWLKVNADSEHAGNIAVVVQDITFCLLNNDGDRDFCENEADDDQLRSRLVLVPFMIAKQESWGKTFGCGLIKIAKLIPGEIGAIGGLVGGIVEKLAKCN